MKSLTIFTPTYNRGHLLPRLYESLCRQTVQDFVWMVIDDGSTDHTKELVEKWNAENKIEIDYYYKENGGMHTGHNLAYKSCKTELNTCIDSDDFMPDNAVELILKKWKEAEDKEKLAGIVGLDAEESGRPIGNKFPEDLKRGSFYEICKKHKIKGDKKFVLRTDIVKQYPHYPEYPGEKLVPLGILYLMIEQDYDYLYSNEVYCVVEYQQEGSSASILRQYKQSPRGFGYSRTVRKKCVKNFKENLFQSIHLGSSAIFLNDYSLLFWKPKVYMNFLAFPFSILLNLYIRYKTK